MSSERGGTSACPCLLSTIRLPAAAVLSVTSPNGARGSSAPPLPHSAPRPCHCREEPQRWRPRSLMLAKRLEDKWITACN